MIYGLRDLEAHFNCLKAPDFKLKASMPSGFLSFWIKSSSACMVDVLVWTNTAGFSHVDCSELAFQYLYASYRQWQKDLNLRKVPYDVRYDRLQMEFWVRQHKQFPHWRGALVESLVQVVDAVPRQPLFLDWQQRLRK